MSNQPMLKRGISQAAAMTGQRDPIQSSGEAAAQAQAQASPMTAIATDARKRYVASMGRGRATRSLFDLGSEYQAGKLG